MKTSIAALGNDFNKRFALYVETEKFQTKVYENYESERLFTQEMIKDLQEIHGPENVKISAPKNAWHGGEVVDIVVNSRVWDCVFENKNLSLVTAQEKIWKAKN